MRKNLLWIAAAFASFGLFSCTEPEAPQKEDSIEFSSETTVTIPANGVTTNIAFTASSDWSAKLSDGADAYAMMSPASGNAGEGVIVLQVRKNNGGDEREFTLTITSGTATGIVKFLQEAPPTATTDVTKLEISGDAGVHELPVSLNVDATISTDADWITVGETKGMTTVTYLIQVEANPSVEESRSATVTVSPAGAEDIVVTVEQAKFIPVLAFVGDIPTIPQAGGTVDLGFETNMDVELVISGIDDVTAEVKDGNIISITAPANEAMAPRALYVGLTATEYEGDGTAVAVNVYQSGIATIDWSVSITEAGANINIAYYTICPMAVSGDYALVSDGVDVFAFNTSDGAFVKKVTPALDEGYFPKSLNSDDAGNIIMADTYADGTTGAKVWWAKDIDSTPATLFTLDNSLGGNMGNFRVKGDVTSTAVVSSVVSVTQSWAAWQITDGKLAGDCVSAAHPANQGTAWSPFYQVCEPIGTQIADGFFYGSYPGRPNIWYCSDPANNTWASVLETAQNWDTDMNTMDVVEVGSKKILLYLPTGFFTYSNVHIGIADVTDPANPVLLGTFGAAFYSGAEATSCYGGGGIVGKVSADGKTLVIYAADGSRDTLAKISIPVSAL